MHLWLLYRLLFLWYGNFWTALFAKSIVSCKQQSGHCAAEEKHLFWCLLHYLPSLLAHPISILFWWVPHSLSLCEIIFVTFYIRVKTYSIYVFSVPVLFHRSFCFIQLSMNDKISFFSNCWMVFQCIFPLSIYSPMHMFIHIPLWYISKFCWFYLKVLPRVWLPFTN